MRPGIRPQPFTTALADSLPGPAGTLNHRTSVGLWLLANRGSETGSDCVNEPARTSWDCGVDYVNDLPVGYAYSPSPGAGWQKESCLTSARSGRPKQDVRRTAGAGLPPVRGGPVRRR